MQKIFTSSVRSWGGESFDGPKAATFRSAQENAWIEVTQNHAVSRGDTSDQTHWRRAVVGATIEVTKDDISRQLTYNL
jgi:hypothetical protein